METAASTKHIVSKPHPIVAGVFDFYLPGIIIGDILTLITSVIGAPLFDFKVSMIISVAINILSLIAVIVYHKFVCKKVSWLSPGEQFAGKIYIDNQKYWTNPYNKNRFILFFIGILSLITIGNAFDTRVTGNVHALSTVVSSFIVHIIGIVLFVLLGKGKIGLKKRNNS